MPTKESLLSKVEKFEGDAGEMPDRFKDMTYEQLMAENQEIRKSVHEIYKMIEATPIKRKKNKGGLNG